MGELRIDPLSGLRVILAEVDEPALAPGGELGGDPLAEGRGDPSLFAAGPAAGVHEVIANGSGAAPRLLDLGPDGLAEALELWRVRMRAHADAAYVHLIVDEVAETEAPATSGAELFALPFVPAAVARERERFTAYFDRTQGRNLLADVLQEEVRRQQRLVTIDREAVAICPFASRAPFHVQVIPRAPRARFEDDGATGAAVLFDVLRRIAAGLGTLPALNVWIRTAPRGAAAFCWRIEVVPRLVQPAGLELGTGLQLCSEPPERAAQRLRDVPPA